MIARIQPLVAAVLSIATAAVLAAAAAHAVPGGGARVDALIGGLPW